MWTPLKRFAKPLSRLLARVRNRPDPLPDDDDLAWFFPPDTLVDPAPWDAYWQAQVTHGVAGFVDLFCNDGELVDAMRTNGLRTVLCVGSVFPWNPEPSGGPDLT